MVSSYRISNLLCVKCSFGALYWTKIYASIKILIIAIKLISLSPSPLHLKLAGACHSISCTHRAEGYILIVYLLVESFQLRIANNLQIFKVQFTLSISNWFYIWWQIISNSIDFSWFKWSFLNIILAFRNLER